MNSFLVLILTTEMFLNLGAGNSSIYWSRRCKKITCVEHDPNWYEHIRKFVREPCEIVLRQTKEEYVNEIMKRGISYDCVIIDGKWRKLCALVAGDYLKPRGIVILDNSDWYPCAAKVLREKYNLIQVNFCGFGPINDYTWITSIFFSRDYDIKTNEDPKAIGGLLQHAEDDN
ncbi:MAG: hypothetical protein QXL34_06700 [Thermosphaera sp.]